MMLRICLVVVAFLLLAGLSGCGEELPGAVPSATPAPTAAKLTAPVLPTSTTAKERHSDKGRSAAAVGAGDLAELVEGNNAFAFGLYRALSDGEGNLFFSPFSISQALAMTSAGARGETLRQMADTLHHGISQSSLHPAFNTLDLTLVSRRKGPPGAAKRALD